MPSSVIGHIAYQESRSELIVTFVSGKTYAYGLVPKRIYDDFRSSGAKGNFFNAHIRDRYPARRIKSDPTHELAARGYAMARRVIDSFLIIRLIEVLERSEQPRSERGGEIYGMRDLLALEEIRRLAQSPAIMGLVHAVIGPEARAVRGIFFDKAPGANWPVQWHQDLSIAVMEKKDIEGWQAWSIKNGIPHVQPPAAILERMVSVRLHLDDCGMDNGPLKVRPGTHSFGRLTHDRMDELAREIPEDICCPNAGDALVMRPLLLHASSPARKPDHRRVIHLEFAPANLLPAGLSWAFG
ncbi:MAG TPA: KTSC domain-containing protein [Micropepsaceae bacterium]|nr:KTSC domain-containing protein [Micropepsaceae bacterium]